MSFSCKKSHNNSSWNKERTKAESVMDLEDVNGRVDDGAAIFNVENRSGCIRRLQKDKHFAPSEAKKMPDKAIMKVDESKLAVRKDVDDLGFALKPAAGAKGTSKASAAPKKQNLVAELGLFASASLSVSAAAPLAPIAPANPDPLPRQELSWRSRPSK